MELGTRPIPPVRLLLFFEFQVNYKGLQIVLYKFSHSSIYSLMLAGIEMIASEAALYEQILRWSGIQSHISTIIHRVWGFVKIYGPRRLSDLSRAIFTVGGQKSAPITHFSANPARFTLSPYYSIKCSKIMPLRN